MISIRNLESEDLPVVAKLHIDHMPLTFPPCRPYLNLMKLVYSSFLSNKDGFCGVATVDGTVVGYVCFHKHPKELYITALKAHPVEFCRNVGLLLLRFPGHFLNGAPRVLKTLRLSRSAAPPAASASDLWEGSFELRPLVVRKDNQGTPAASRLMSWGEEVLMKRGENRYFLRVRKDNPRAIAFYNRIGLKTAAIEDIRIVMIKDLT